MNQKVTLPILLLFCAIAAWTGGFDILYALQDRDFDIKHKLRSIPARFGVNQSLIISRLCFAIMVACLSAIGFMTHRGLIYFAGIALIAALLTYEHWLIRDSNEKQVSKNLNLAFFNTNAYVSIIYLVFIAADFLVVYASRSA